MTNPNSVKLALTCARTAVNADRKCEYATAIVNYREVINILEAEIPSFLETQQPALYEKCVLYQSRLDELELISGNAGVVIPPKEIEFSEDPPAGPLPDAHPTLAVLKPFWLMRVWAKTMSVGGYVTPKLYVPKVLWYQSGCKFAAFQTKLTSCEALLEGLAKLKESYPDGLDRELDNFSSQLDIIQNSLHFHLAFIAEVKKDDKEKAGWGSRMKKLGDTLAKGAARLASSQRDEGYDYILLLRSVFEEAQFLDEWLTHFTPTGSPIIAGKLKRVSEFFYDVVCQFAIRDFHTLVERYIKKNLVSFIKLNSK